MGYWPSMRSRWLDICHVHFCVLMDRDEVHKHAKKERGQYPAILINKRIIMWKKGYHFLAGHGGLPLVGKIAPSSRLSWKGAAFVCKWTNGNFYQRTDSHQNVQWVLNLAWCLFCSETQMTGNWGPAVLTAGRNDEDCFICEFDVRSRKSIRNNDLMNCTYGLLTKREVKMAGYWPSSFIACLWTETKSRSINTQKKNEANIQPPWPNKLGQ